MYLHWHQAARPVVLRHGQACAVAKGQPRAWGNQREKLYMTTAAMRVLPSPVGSATSVLCSSAVRIMASWYARSGTLAGYIQCRALCLQVSTAQEWGLTKGLERVGWQASISNFANTVGSTHTSAAGALTTKFPTKEMAALLTC